MQPLHDKFTKLNGFELIEDLGELKSTQSENIRIRFLNLFAPEDEIVSEKEEEGLRFQGYR